MEASDHDVAPKTVTTDAVAEPTQPTRRRTLLVDARPKTHARRRLTTTRQSRTSTPSDRALLARISQRIANLYSSGAIQLVVENGTREVMTPEIGATLATLRAKRNVIENKLGPTRLPSGYVHELRLNGKAYVFEPYVAWREQFRRATSFGQPPSTRFRNRRDELVWLLWNLRHRAMIEVAETAHKVCGSLVECPRCGHQHPHHSRARDEHGFTRCRKCGEGTHRDVRERLDRKPFGRITKTGLLRRFRLSERNLDRVLAEPFPG